MKKRRRRGRKRRDEEGINDEDDDEDDNGRNIPPPAPLINQWDFKEGNIQLLIYYSGPNFTSGRKRRIGRLQHNILVEVE
jgi:hypothetical protein